MIDIYARSQELLETIANSIYDRDPQLDKPFFFSIQENQLVDAWLNEFRKECLKEKGQIVL